MPLVDGRNRDLPEDFSILASLKDDGVFISPSETSSKLVQRIIMTFSG